MAVRKLEHTTGSAPGFAELRTLLTQTIAATRTLTFELSPPILYDLGLAAALDWLAEKTTAQHAIPVVFTQQGDVGDIDQPLAILLFQSVRELLFNMVKHAKATQAAILLRDDAPDVEIVVTDNGAGFDAARLDAHGHAQGGFGLFSIRERLGSQGGYMEIESSPGNGARITLVSPMRPAATSATDGCGLAEDK